MVKYQQQRKIIIQKRNPNNFWGVWNEMGIILDNMAVVADLV